MPYNKRIPALSPNTYYYYIPPKQKGFTLCLIIPKTKEVINKNNKHHPCAVGNTIVCGAQMALSAVTVSDKQANISILQQAGRGVSCLHVN